MGIFISFVINISSLGSWKQYINSATNHTNTTILSSRMKILATLPFAFSGIILIIYFVFIAYCMSCQTIGKKISGIKIVDCKTLQKPKIVQLFKHEFFISILPAICSLAIFIFCASIKNSNFEKIFGNDNIHVKNDSIENSIFVTIGSFYAFSYSIIFFIIIFLLLSKRKIAFHDVLSATRTVMCTKHKISKKVKISNHVNSNPLEIFQAKSKHVQK